MAEKVLRAIYSGIVQGVGFRFTARNIARRHKVLGWVKNLSDGTVEVCASGSDKNVRFFLRDLGDEFKQGITNIAIIGDACAEELSEFQIRFS